MAFREVIITLDPKDWYSSDARREFHLVDARRQARAGKVCVIIRVKDRFGSRQVASVDARYWMHDPVKDVDHPAPKWSELPGALERRQAAAKLAEEIGVPSFITGDE